MKKGLFSPHRRGGNEAHSQTAGKNALAAVNPEGAGCQALRVLSSLLPNLWSAVEVISCCTLFGVFGENTSTLAQASPHTWTGVSRMEGLMVKENRVHPALPVTGRGSKPQSEEFWKAMLDNVE